MASISCSVALMISCFRAETQRHIALVWDICFDSFDIMKTQLKVKNRNTKTPWIHRHSMSMGSTLNSTMLHGDGGTAGRSVSSASITLPLVLRRLARKQWMDRISTDVALHASTTERVTQHDQVKQYRRNKNLKLLHNITQRNTTPPGHCCCCDRLAVQLQGDEFHRQFSSVH